MLAERNEVGGSCFHPLKAGRRLACRHVIDEWFYLFPSPQGGSETGARYALTPLSRYVSIPSRRVGDV